MRSSALFMSAALAAFRLVCATPLPQSAVSARVPTFHGVRTRPQQRLAIGDDDDDLDLPRFDNSVYTPSATEALEEALKQDRPLPTQYLLSLQQSRNTEARRPQHTAAPTNPVSAKAPEQDKKHSKSMEEVAMTTGQDQEGIYAPDLLALASAYPDLLVIVLMVAFIVVVVLVETVNWAIVKHGTTRFKVRTKDLIRCMRAKSVRLEGEERRLYAETCIQPQLEEEKEQNIKENK